MITAFLLLYSELIHGDRGKRGAEIQLQQPIANNCHHGLHELLRPLRSDLVQNHEIGVVGCAVRFYHLRVTGGDRSHEKSVVNEGLRQNGLGLLDVAVDLHDVVLRVRRRKRSNGDHVIHDVIREEANLPLAGNCGVERAEHGLTLLISAMRDSGLG